MQKLVFDPFEFEKTDVSGVPVYWKNVPSAPCIYVHVVFDCGSFDDPKGKEGVAHFFEHLIFNGSPSLPDKKAVNEWSKQYALNSWNAWTSFYNTNFHLKCLPENFDTVLIGIKDKI